MDGRFDEIAAFADIGEFIDQPVRTYSSGMFVRLAFAVGIHVSPDILVIDEALSVGDEAFQRKCFLRIRGFREGGGTVLFVSHNTNMVATYCDHVIFLDQGKLLMHAAPGPAISGYRRLLNATQEQRDALLSALQCHTSEDDWVESDQNPDPASSLSSMHVKVENDAVMGSLHFVSLSGARSMVLVHGREYELAYDVIFQKEAHNVIVTAYVTLKNGFILGTLSAPEQAAPLSVQRGQAVNFRLFFNCILIPGVYMLDCEVNGDVDGANTP